MVKLNRADLDSLNEVLNGISRLMDGREMYIVFAGLVEMTAFGLLTLPMEDRPAAMTRFNEHVAKRMSEMIAAESSARPPAPARKRHYDA